MRTNLNQVECTCAKTKIKRSAAGSEHRIPWNGMQTEFIQLLVLHDSLLTGLEILGMDRYLSKVFARWRWKFITASHSRLKFAVGRHKSISPINFWTHGYRPPALLLRTQGVRAMCVCHCPSPVCYLQTWREEIHLVVGWVEPLSLVKDLIGECGQIGMW